MNLPALRERLEQSQILLYGLTVAAALGLAWAVPGTQRLEAAINPALALMLFVTFLQVPVAELGRAFTQRRFLGTLLVANFVGVPFLVGGLVQWLPAEPLLRLGVLLVLLAPCIDWVVTFSHLGGANARLLLAATPVLLLVQMLLLPVYLRLFLGEAAATLVQPGPFVDAFVWLIALPLAAAALLQHGRARRAAARQRHAPLNARDRTSPDSTGKQGEAEKQQPSAGMKPPAHGEPETSIAASNINEQLNTLLGVLPVPATALVLFVVVASVVPQLGAARQAALQVLPVYLGFSTLAPVLGWMLARRLGRLDVPAARAVAFSAATRNSLVVLPLALAVPGAVPVLPAIVVTQTLVELVASVVYMRVMPGVGGKQARR